MENTPQNIKVSDEEGIDIKKYIFLILSHWWWFAITIFISLTIAYLINRYTQEIYNVSCSLIVGEPKGESGTMESIVDELARVRNRKRKAVVENEISILKSYSLARMTLEELDFGITYTAVGRRNIAQSQLYKNAPFIVIPDTLNEILPIGTYNLNIISEEKYRLSVDDLFEQTLKFGERFEYNNMAFTVKLRNPDLFSIENLTVNKYTFTFNNINQLSKAYSNKLGVLVNAEKGSILTLSMNGFVREQITDYLNKLCEVYIRKNLEEKNLASVNTINFIDFQLQGIVDSLESTGLRLQQFRSANKVVDLSIEGSFLIEKMQNHLSEKATLDINNRYYKYLLEYIEKRTDYSDVIAPSVIGIQDPLLNKLVSELNQLNLQRRNLYLSVMENSPQLAIINNQISNTRNALKENLKSLIKVNTIALEEVDQRLETIEKGVQKLPGTERQLINIEREFTINDQIYTFLLEKRAEAGITRASNTSDHKILDIARPENVNMIKPKKSMNYATGLMIGGGIPLALLLLLQFFNTKIIDRKYLGTNLKAPIIGNIGHNDIGTELPVNENPSSSLSESFRALRTNLQYILKEPNAKVIAISSAISGEGKTFTSVNLASILAVMEKKTLLISLDLRRPKIHKVFNLNNSSGMSTFLINKSTFSEIVYETNINNLFVATSGPIPPNPAELLSSERMNEFIKDARKKYDYIILDTPPVAIVTDTLMLKDFLDAFVFVIRHNYSDKQVVDLVNSIHEKQIIKNIGVVVNDIQLKGYYGYSYRYGYGYGYGYGYNYGYYKGYYAEQKTDDNLFYRLKNILFRKNRG